MAKEGRLWLESPMKTALTTSVVDVHKHEKNTMVVTKETIFFPGGGGQAPDEGTVSGCNLLGLVELDEGFGHLIKESLDSQTTALKLDVSNRQWAAQQHTGQHILSALCYREHNLQTLSVHFGKDMCTLDLDTPPLTEEILRKIERAANDLCRRSLTITGHLLTKEEVGSIPNLRKRPQVEEDIRIVEIADFDSVPCCGTHLENTAHASPIMIYGQTKMRGKARLQFLCGNGALAFANKNYKDLSTIGELFDSPLSAASERCRQVKEELEKLRYDYKGIRDKYLQSAFQSEALGRAKTIGNCTFVFWQTTEIEPKQLGKFIGDACKTDGRLVVVAAPVGEKSSVAIARSSNITVSCCKILREALTKLGGRGGGKDGQAQGSVPTAKLDEALQLIEELVQTKLGT